MRRQALRATARSHATLIECALVLLVAGGALWGLARWIGTPLVELALGPGEVPACEAAVDDRAVAWRPVLFEGAFRDAPTSVDSEIDRWTRTFAGSFGPTFRTFLGRTGRYESMVLDALRKYDIPDDFIYLAVIESGMNPHAYSHAHAVGMWQFISATARSEGLEVGWSVDERRDPVAATDAAARHLTDLYGTFGDWALAAAAYNAGEYRVKSARRRAGGDASFWELAERRLLPPETRAYVPKLVAAARVGHDPLGTELGFVPREPALEWRDVEVAPASRLDAIARAAGVSADRVRSLNPHLRQDITAPLGATSTVRLPVDAATGFEARWAQLPESERRGSVVHVVQARETLGRIAESYGVSVDLLLDVNQVEPRRLRPGQELTVPVGSL